MAPERIVARELREAREDFCRHRRSSHLSRWMSWITLRGKVEGWTEDETFAAIAILAAAETWRRGFRPPQSFREASSRIRGDRRAGQLREPGW